MNFNPVITIRETTAKSLGASDKRLRGDAEIVVSKALAKDPNQRYRTAQAFGDDLRRILDGRALSVGPATFATTFRRWIVREESIRLAGWACVIGYSFDALVFLVYLSAGLIARFWWPPVLPRTIRHPDFVLNAAAWTIYTSLLAWVNWQVAQANIPATWFSLANSVGPVSYTHLTLPTILRV